MRTTKPVPVKLKKIRGTYRKDRDSHGLTIQPSKAIPEAPEYFTPMQKEIWQAICTTLKAIDLLQPVGMPFVEIYCQQAGLYQRALEDIQENGATTTTESRYGTVIKKNPSLEIMNQAFKVMTDISDRFGFTPLSQSRIKGISREPEDIFDDEFNI